MGSKIISARNIAIVEAAVIIILMFILMSGPESVPGGESWGGLGGGFDGGSGTPLPESSGIPEYVGASTVPFSEEARTGFNIPEDVNAYGYLTSDSPADVTDWYKNNMDDWTLEKEDTMSSPEEEVPMQYYRRDDMGAFIFSVAVSTSQTFIGIAIDSWETIQSCGPTGAPGDSPGSTPGGDSGDFQSGPSEAMKELGIPLYEGAQKVPLPDTTKEDLSVPQNATMDGYTTLISNPPSEVMDWYKNNMEGWSLENEVVSEGEPAIYMHYYKKDDNGAFIVTTTVTEPDETIIIIFTGEWSIIQGCGPEVG